MENLYVRHDHIECGPYSLEQARFLVSSGKLSPSDLAQQSETDPWKPLSSFLSPAASTPPPWRLILKLVLALILAGVTLIAALLLYAPLEEWAGFGHVAFDQRAIKAGHLPPNRQASLLL